MTEAAGPYLAGPYLAACVLLVVAGVAKLRRPEPTRAALASAGLALPALPVRLLGGVEVALGAVGASTAAAGPALAVAAAYAAFAGFTLVSLRRRDGAGCGCFGEATAPLHPLHVVVDLALAAAALVVTAGGGVVASAGARGALTVLGAAVAWVAYLVLVPLPRLLGAVAEAGR